MRLLKTTVALGAIFASMLSAAASGQAAAGSAFVRVDQVGYASASPKRAYLMSHADQSGAPFSLLRAGDGTPVFSGTVGASLGAWSKRFGRVYALDFDAVQEPGTYTL